LKRNSKPSKSRRKQFNGTFGLLVLPGRGYSLVATGGVLGAKPPQTKLQDPQN